MPCHAMPCRAMPPPCRAVPCRRHGMPCRGHIMTSCTMACHGAPCCGTVPAKFGAVPSRRVPACQAAAPPCRAMPCRVVAISWQARRWCVLVPHAVAPSLPSLGPFRLAVCPHAKPRRCGEPCRHATASRAMVQHIVAGCTMVRHDAQGHGT
jgi:hypothetical protein